MKKVLFAILASAVLVTATACSNTDKDAAETESPAASHIVQQPLLPSIEPAPSTAPASDSTNTIVATAIGEIDVTPDVAYISVGMSTTGDKAEQVQKTNDETMAKIIAAIKKAGIAETDIKTSEYSVYPEYNYSSNRQIIKGYIAVNRANITINDINSVGKVLEAAQGAGANEIGDITFSVKDRNGAYDLALTEAISAARTRAQVMADAAGVSLGGLVNVSETGYSSPYLSRSSGYEYAAQESMDSASSAGAGISTGELKITANATVVFEIQ